MRVLPKELRDKLKEPIGQLVDEKELLKLLQYKKYIVSIGDQVTFTLLKNGFNPIICIVDYIVKRKECTPEIKDTIQSYGKKHIRIQNPPGQITDQLWSAIESAYSHLGEETLCIEIHGEEDLAALPAIYLAPPDVTIIYGLPNKGVVVVKATKENKSKVKEILDRM
jgi:uncharacterized protein (UPF0218 family)